MMKTRTTELWQSPKGNGSMVAGEIRMFSDFRMEFHLKHTSIVCFILSELTLLVVYSQRAD